MFFKKEKSFDEYVKQGLNDPNIVFIDVRGNDEYEIDHVKGSINLPLSKLSSIEIDKDKTLYVYCYSGSRSNMACSQLKKLGYKNVINIGGVNKSKLIKV